MPKTTPAPWAYNPQTGEVYAADPKYPYAVCIATPVFNPNGDGLLIAAAPDLLAASEALLTADLAVQNNQTLTAPQWDELIDALSAAVEKAHGR